ncbi:MAG: hypothetical protein ABI547_05480 [Betaproteobacteria bacterium]
MPEQQPAAQLAALAVPVVAVAPASVAVARPAVVAVAPASVAVARPAAVAVPASVRPVVEAEERAYVLPAAVP